MTTLAEVLDEWRQLIAEQEPEQLTHAQLLATWRYYAERFRTADDTTPHPETGITERGAACTVLDGIERMAIELRPRDAADFYHLAQLAEEMLAAGATFYLPQILRSISIEIAETYRLPGEALH